MSVSATSDLELAEAEAGARVDLVAGGEIAARSPWQLFMRRFREDKFALAGLTFLAFVILVAIFAPLVCSLVVAFVSTFLTTVFGVFCGLFAGYYRGWVDTIVSRTVDAWLAIPYLLFAIGLASACSFGNGCIGGLIKPGVPVVIAVIALTSWTYPARIIRGQVLSLREKEFVDAARSLGASDFRIIVKELTPNLTAPIVVFATTFLPQAILFEAALSFLGVGVQPPTPSWGQLISDAAPNIATQWWYMLFPGLALLFTVLAFNFVGDAMTDALNPRTRKA